MIDLLTASENQVFVVSLAVMLIIALLEGVGMLLGAGLSEFLETFLPEIDADVDVDIDLDGPQTSPPLFTRFLSWLRIGEVPILMVIVVFLTTFGLIGLVIQSFVAALVGSPLPKWIAVIPALMLALPVTRVSAGVLAMVMPKDETDAVAESTFVGRIATVTLGTARVGSPAEAKLEDEHGQVHYIMIEPDAEPNEFAQGTEVLITEHSGSVFKGIVNQTAALVD
jgi:Inner membrane protein YqiJ, N-terminal/Inner membrane protein YqiJ, OB-fold